jgi:hypothetical protein
MNNYYVCNNARKTYVGLKVLYGEDNVMDSVLASRSLIWNYKYDMIKKQMKMSSCVQLKCYVFVAYELSHGESRSWEEDNRRIDDMALGCGHDGLMCKLYLVRLRACNQVKNLMCVSRDCDIAWIKSRWCSRCVIQRMVMRELSLWHACLEEEDCVRNHVQG